MGVAIGDYDNDGWPDIFLASVTRNQLFHNNHDGTFTEVTVKAGVGGGMLDGKKMWSIAAGWFDFDKTYKKIEVGQQCEVASAIGDVAVGDDGEANLHVHVVLGLSDGTTRGGHLMAARSGPRSKSSWATHQSICDGRRIRTSASR